MSAVTRSDSMDPYQPAPASSTGNPWFAVSMGLIGLIVGYGISSVQSNFSTFAPAAPQQVAQAPTVPDAPPPPPSEPPTIDDDPIEGDANAKVTVIEFTDFQCPFCQRHFTETYGQIKKDYVDTGKIKYVVRDYPLSFHPNAQPAAEAAGCAAEQNKFWEMHDKLFTNGDAWSNLTDAKATFKQYAADLKLNTTAFNTCLDSGKRAAEIQADLADGTSSGVNGTPGFWVLGPNDQSELISGALPYSAFKSTIDKMLGS